MFAYLKGMPHRRNRSIGPSGNRRKFLKAGGAGAVAFTIAGCSGSDTSDTTTTSDDTTTEGGDETTDETTTTAGNEAEVGGTYIRGYTSDAKVLVPFLESDEVSSEALNRMVDYGAHISEDIEMDGFFFETWEQNDANDVVTYKLRENLEYGAGYGELTADDYIFSIENLRQVQESWTGYSYTDQFYINGDPIEVEKLGKYEFRANLPEARANYKFNDYISYMRPLPQDLLKKYLPSFQDDSEAAKENFTQQIKKDPDLKDGSWTGNLGAYNLQNWERQSKLTFERNPDYYLAGEDEYPEDIPYPETFVMQIFDEESTITSALKNGGVTQAAIDEFKADTFEQNDEVQVWHSQYGSGLFYVSLNHRINGWEGLRNRDVRHGLAMALDKNAMTEKIAQGYADPAHTWSPTWGPYYDEEGVWKPNGPRIEEAKSKIESGLSDKGYQYDGDQLVGPDGNQVELTLAWLTGSRSVKLTKDYLKQQFGKIGIKLNLEGVNWNTLLGSYAANSHKNLTEEQKQNNLNDGEPDWTAGPYNGGPWNQSVSKEQWDLMTGIGFDHGAYSPWSVIKMQFSEKGSFNWFGLSPEKDVAKLANNAAAASNQQKTKENLQEVLVYLSEYQPVLFTQSEHALIGYRESVQGLEEAENFYTQNSANSANRHLWLDE